MGMVGVGMMVWRIAGEVGMEDTWVVKAWVEDLVRPMVVECRTCSRCSR